MSNINEWALKEKFPQFLKTALYVRCNKGITLNTLHRVEQSGAAEACWAHNPEVDGSKPSSASCFVFFLRELFCIFPEGGAKGARRGREGARWLEEMKDCSLSNPVARLSIPNENVGNPGVNFYSKKILRRK